MRRKIINLLKRFSSQIFGIKAKSFSEPAEPDLPVSKISLCIPRIKQILSESGIRPYKGKTPRIWYVKTVDFTDAYRLLLRLGKQEGLVSMKCRGHVCYRLDLPDGKGNIILSDHVGHRRNTLAIMSFDIEEIPEIKEVRFHGSSDKTI